MKSFFIIDGSALLYRSYFAFIQRPLINSRGMDVSAVYGFTSTIHSILKQEKPDRICVAFDTREKTVRHDAFEAYKATRQETPEQIVAQFPHVMQVIEAFNIAVLTAPGYEADDIIATLCARYSEKDQMIYIVSADKDLLQLVNETTVMYNIRGGVSKREIMDRQAVIDKLGVPPELVVDYLALIGDASDNIPGVPGVGPKTAVKLLDEFGSLDAVVENAGKITQNKVRESVIASRENIPLVRRLLTLHRDLTLHTGTDDLDSCAPDREKLVPLLKAFEFNRLLKEYEEVPQREMSSVRPVPLGTVPVSGSDDLEAFIQSVEKTHAVYACINKDTGFLVLYSGDCAYMSIDAESGSFVDKDLAEVISNPGTALSAFVLKDCIKAFAGKRIGLKGPVFDAGIASYVIDPGFAPKDPGDFARKYLDDETGRLSCNGYEECKKALSYLPEIEKKIREKVRAHKAEELLEKYEIPLVSILAAMEDAGVKIDRAELAAFDKEMTGGMESLTEQIYAECGEVFNINSPQQLAVVLFDHLAIQDQFTGIKLKKKKTGYSTDSSVLQSFMPHPTIEKILLYRQYSKLKSTYLDVFTALTEKEPFIHTTFNQTLTQTGRLSSSSPNMQNIPTKTALGKRFRKIFVSRFSRGSLLAFDYSQIELRLVAHCSGDESLYAAFNEDRDVHTETASKIFRVKPEMVTKNMRSVAKVINFGIIYGMGPHKLAKELSVSFTEARRFIDVYFAGFPGVKAYIDATIARAKTRGYVETLMNRRRYVLDINSSNQAVRSASENIAVNTPIQGSAADLVKMAMVKVDRALRDRGLKSLMVLQVHDELVFDVPEEEVSALETLVTDIMEHTMDLSVPLKVDIHKGKNWFEASK